MKKIVLVLIGAMASASAFAQVESGSQPENTSPTESTETTSVDASDKAGISDENLRKYAVTMDSINGMKQTLLSEIGNMVKSNEGMTNARYNEVSKAMKNEAKLAELKATETEIDFINQVMEKKNDGAAKISETFQSMAKDYVGIAAYNDIKTSLETDSDLKARYDKILSEVAAEGSASAN